MTFWNSDEIKTYLGKLEPPTDKSVSPVKVDSVVEAAMELSLGPEAYISGGRDKKILKAGDMVTIAPGEIAMLLTEEWVEVPKDVLGFISLKTRIKVPGLINVSGFHVDPGFKGRLIFTVYNAGTETCAFTRGQKMFLLWFADLREPGEEKEHKGNRQELKMIKGDEISRLTGEVKSPAKLHERLQKLEVSIKIYGVLLVAFVLMMSAMFIDNVFDKTSNSPSNNTPAQEEKIHEEVKPDPLSKLPPTAKTDSSDTSDLTPEKE